VSFRKDNLLSSPRFFILILLVPLLLVCISLHTEANAAQLALSWTDNSTNEDGFKIERKPASGGAFTQIATTGPDTTAYSDPLLNDATTHCYRVRAFNASADSAYSNETCASDMSRERTIAERFWIG